MTDILIWQGTASLVQDGKDTPVQAKLFRGAEPTHMGSVASLPTYPVSLRARLPDLAFGPRAGEATLRLPDGTALAVRLLAVESSLTRGPGVISADVVDAQRAIDAVGAG